MPVTEILKKLENRGSVAVDVIFGLRLKHFSLKILLCKSH